MEPADPFSRFEVLTKNITENNRDLSAPRVLEQTIQYRCSGANSVSPTLNPTEDLSYSNTRGSFKSNYQSEAPTEVNHLSKFANKVTFRKPIQQSMQLKRGEFSDQKQEVLSQTSSGLVSMNRGKIIARKFGTPSYHDRNESFNASSCLSPFNRA